MSGSAMTTFGFPPNLGNLASMSPNVLETDNRPGRTLWGPRITWPPISLGAISDLMFIILVYW
jgi:hypothetical protein